MALRCFVQHANKQALITLVLLTASSLFGDVVGAQPRAPYRFIDVTRRAGLDHAKTGTWGSLWIDYDRSGFPDLFIGRHGVNPFLFDNRGGTYDRRRIDFVKPPGYSHLDQDDWVDRHSCAWGEATGDGRPDLYCTVGANLGTSLGPNQLLVKKGGRFRDRAHHCRVRDRYGRGRSVNWLDYDTDGDLDLYVGNWARPGHPSALFDNRRGRFRRVSAGVEDQLRTISSSWSDWDRDGDPDLLVLQYGAPTIAYENRDGRFVSVTLPLVTDGYWHSAAWGDYNGDGFTDLSLVNYTESLVLRNGHNGFEVADRRALEQGRMSAWIDLENDADLDLFVVQGAPGLYPSSQSHNAPDLLLFNRGRDFAPARGHPFARPRGGNGDSAAVSDHDRDGRVDLFVTNGYFEYTQWRGRSLLLENRTEAGNWIGLNLHGGHWNPLGIGARIRVDTRALSYRREISDGVTFRAQSEVGYVHLGIADAPAALVRVRWSDGTEDCVAVLAGQIADVRRGQHPCPPL